MKLSEKTVVIHGPVTGIVQSLANHLTELGADVALATDDEKVAQVYCSNLTDLREVHRDRGRAAPILGKRNSLKSCEEIFSRASEAFGSVDIYIDANSPAEFVADLTDTAKLDAGIRLSLRRTEETIFMAMTARHFISSRSRGRLIFLSQEGLQRGLAGNVLNSISRPSIKDFVKSVSIEHQEKQMTANVVVCGINENFLQSKNTKQSIAESKKEIESQVPGLRITEPIEVAQLVGFLASPHSSGVTGQVIYATHGL